MEYIKTNSKKECEIPCHFLDKSSVSIVVPCYNEEASISIFQKEIIKILTNIKDKINSNFEYEIIFIDDGSQDKTAVEIKKLCNKFNNTHLIKFSRNFGKEAAILAGFRMAKNSGIVLIDADLQHPVYLIEKMYEIWYNNKADIIYAIRKDRKGESFLKSKLSEIFYKISNIISDVKLKPGVSDFRLMDKKVVDILVAMNEYHRFSKAMFEWVGFKKTALEYDYAPRISGKTSWSYMKLFKYAIEGMISFSTTPLKISFWIGLMISFISGAYGIFIVFDTIINGNTVKGYPSMLTIILFLGGIQLIFLGIIGQYIARIYEQVKDRPHYIVEEEI
ncbi:glycosyltransferase family 2 protein [Campylobacter fetus]|nr:glycosyltransferase family 2 protein [Campylobacter fetus]